MKYTTLRTWVTAFYSAAANERKEREREWGKKKQKNTEENRKDKDVMANGERGRRLGG